MVKLSVLMPVYNASKSLENALKSVLSQKLDDIEIICVNDGSTDNSLNILETYSEKYSFLKIYNQENFGPGNARNKAINESKGDYVAFIDADDVYLDENSLKRMYSIAVKNNADVVAANLKYIAPDAKIVENYDYSNVKYAYFEEELEIKPYEYGIPWAFYKNIYKREFLLKNNIYFPELKAGEDPIFLSEVFINVEKIFTTNLDFYGYNYSIGGGLNIKLNNYKKKYDYIQHFTKVFDILDQNEFTNVKENYKKEFIEYITFRDNLNDKDIKNIIREIFVDDTYFSKKDYGFLIIHLLKENDDNVLEDYDFMKYCLFEESMLEESFIDYDSLQDYLRLYDDTRKVNSYKQLKEIEQYTFENKRKINSSVDKLRKEIKHYVTLNNAILSSNSWKLTGFLRILKQKF